MNHPEPQHTAATTTTAGLPTPEPEGARRARLPAGVALAAGAGVAVLLAYAADLRGLAHIWSTEADYSHGFLVIPVAAWIFWQYRPRGADADRVAPSWLGWPILAAILVARAFLYESGEYWLETATILPAAAAVVLALGGLPLLRKTWPAIAFLALMLTVPKGLNDRIALPLQRVATVFSCGTLRLLGFWVMNEGNVIVVNDQRLEVATACNGLAMLISLTATGAAIILLVPAQPWKKFLLAISIVPIALSCNVARIAATAWCYQAFGTAAGKQFAHDAAGWLMMPLSLLLMGLEMAWMSWLVRVEEVETLGIPSTSTATRDLIGAPSRV